MTSPPSPTFVRSFCLIKVSIVHGSASICGSFRFIPTIRTISLPFCPTISMLLHLSSLNHLLLLILALSFSNFTVAATLPSNVREALTSPVLTPGGHVKRGGPPNKDTQHYVPPHLRKSSPPLSIPGPRTLSIPRIDNPRYSPTPNYGPAAQQPIGRGGGNYGLHWKEDPKKIPATFSHPLNKPESFLRGPQSNSNTKVSTGTDWRSPYSDFSAVSAQRVLTGPRRKPLSGSREREATKSGGQGGGSRMAPAMQYPKLRSASAQRFQGRVGGGRYATGGRGGRGLVDLGRNLPKPRVLSATQYQPSPGSEMFELINSSEIGGPKLVDLSKNRPKPRILSVTPYQPSPDSKNSEFINSSERVKPTLVDPSKKQMSTTATITTNPPPSSGQLPQAEGPSSGADVRSLQGLHPKSRLHKWTSSRRMEGGDAKLKKRTPTSTTASPSAALPHRGEQLSTAADVRAPSLLEDLPPKSRLHKWMSSGPGHAARESAHRKQMAISIAASPSTVLSHHTELGPDMPAKSILHDIPVTSRLHKWRNSASGSGEQKSEQSERTPNASNLPRIPPRHV